MKDDTNTKAGMTPSKIDQYVGSVTPPRRPVDFQKLRDEFEQHVADEVMSEFETRDERPDSDKG